ncbi:MAG: 4Fe-4S binding protein [Eubacteriales bacterium]|nr:4Fe-4S binding protein [Eubacteriales bacterium]
MNKALQMIVQLIFLILFFALISMGKIQLWMGLFVMGIITAAWFSRIYCGWICPINTAIRFITRLKKKLHIESFKVPLLLTKPSIRFIALAAFFAAFLVSVLSGVKLPVLPVVFMLGVITALFYPPDLWHHTLCPFGTILSLPARLSRHSVQINPAKCVNCGICYQICPAKSVKRLDDSCQIIKNECLVCMKCSRECPKNAITYQ